VVGSYLHSLTARWKKSIECRATISQVEATYRLAKQFSHGAHWARVTASVEAAPQDRVAIADAAFAWREYSSGPYGELLSAEAVEGVLYALGKLPADRPQYHVTVSKIEYTETDTGPGDVKLAAAHATLTALDFEPSDPPWISKDGPVFPS
jgi:hypothetical protein